MEEWKEEEKRVAVLDLKLLVSQISQNAFAFTLSLSARSLSPGSRTTLNITITKV